MPRYIDADALVAELQKKPIHDGHFIHTRDVSDAIFNAPTISPDEVRGVGEWISNHDGSWNCSECGLRVLIYAKGNYCPSCGERKKGADDSE